MIEPTSLNGASEVGVASTFEDFFLAEHERLFCLDGGGYIS
jgi:hypothetical protein